MYRDSEIHYSEEDVMLVDEQKEETLHIHSTTNIHEVVSMDSRCEHTGDCGSANHQGNNFCYWCSICNPDNEDAY